MMHLPLAELPEHKSTLHGQTHMVETESASLMISEEFSFRVVHYPLRTQTTQTTQTETALAGHVAQETSGNGRHEIRNQQ